MFYVQVTVFLIIVWLIVSSIGIFPAKSVTNDINNYKKFDIQVQNDVYEFFPDDIEQYNVIKYDYYYSYPYHHVYNVYLELYIDDNLDEFISKYKTGEYIERQFKFDENFTEIVFDDKIEYYSGQDKIHRGDIKKILYSSSKHIVIFEYFQSWSFCKVEDVYYFERFNININEYSLYLESLD